MSKSDKRIMVLKKASKEKSKKTFLKVKESLGIMKTKNIPINFESVAKFAGISKTWLYNHAKFKDEIERARIKTGKLKRLIINSEDLLKNKTNKIAKLKKEYKTLKDKNKTLSRELEIVHGELYKLRHEKQKA